MIFRGSATIRITRSLALGAGIALIAASCGGDDKSGLEELLEQQSGGDVDLDDGFSFQTDEGGMSIDEDGNFVITGENGEVITGQAGEDGFNIESEEGTITGSQDDEGGFTIEGEDGSITGNEEDGNFTIEGEDGSFSVSSGTELPSEWPDDVPQPDGLAITTSSIIGTGDELLIGIVGTASQDQSEFIEDYGDALTSAGFEQTSSFESEGSMFRIYTNGTWNASVSGFDDGNEQGVSINLVQES